MLWFGDWSFGIVEGNTLAKINNYRVKLLVMPFFQDNVIGFEVIVGRSTSVNVHQCARCDVENSVLLFLFGNLVVFCRFIIQLGSLHCPHGTSAQGSVAFFSGSHQTEEECQDDPPVVVGSMPHVLTFFVKGTNCGCYHKKKFFLYTF